MICIVFNYIKYKDNDAIVDAISEKGLITFLAKGLLKTTCKNSFLKTTPSICEIEFLPDKYKYPILKNGKCLVSPYLNNLDLETSAAILSINEVIIKCIQKEEVFKIYTLLFDVIKNIHNGYNPLVGLVKILNEVLIINGSSMNLNECNKCHSKDSIIGFSFREGGFLCSNCGNSIQFDFIEDTMLLYKEICLKDFSTTETYKYFSKNIILEIINKTCFYIHDSIGADIKNIKLL